MTFQDILNSARELLSGGANTKKQLEQAQMQAEDLADYNDAMKSELAYMQTPHYLQKKANELGYVQPEKVIELGKPQGQILGVNSVEPTTTAQPTQMPQNITFDKLLEGFGRYGATPSAEAVKVMADAPNRYPIYKQHPYLLPAASIVETGAGQNMTRPKTSPNPQNLLNWGIYTDFAPKTQAEAVERALTGIGERSPYYQKFRDSGSLEDFVNTYAPASDGNEGYMDKLMKAMAYFQ